MNLLNLFLTTGKLKKIKRSGWIREKISDPESVAEHSYQLSVLAMVLAPLLKVNSEKLIKMAIIHDLGETDIGDWVVERWNKIDNNMKRKKEKLEIQAIKNIFKQKGKDYEDLFNEMIKKKSKEAKLLWQLDKLEMALQAYEYEIEQNKNLQEFFVNSQMHITNPILKRILHEMLAQRTQHPVSLNQK